MKTYAPDDLVRSRIEWARGEFGPEWTPFREAAAERGFVFPPDGDATDTAEDPMPSQRAIVWREIDERPAALLEAIGRSHSWAEVVAIVIGRLDAIRSTVDVTERVIEEVRLTRRLVDRADAAATLRELERRTGARVR